MNWFPLAILLFLAGIGLIVRRYGFERLAVIGYYAGGILVAWLGLSWIRGAVLVPLGASWQLADLVFAPATLFATEGWILLFAVGAECFFLQGRYRLDDECKATLTSGIKTSAIYIAATTVFAFFAWWLIRPGEVGRFDVTLVHALTSQRATAIYAASTDDASASLNEIIWIQNTSAIPDALIIGGLLVCLIPLVRPAFRYFKMVLEDEYLHLPPKKDESNPQTKFPTPRGRRMT